MMSPSPSTPMLLFLSLFSLLPTILEGRKCLQPHPFRSRRPFLSLSPSDAGEVFTNPAKKCSGTSTLTPSPETSSDAFQILLPIINSKVYDVVNETPLDFAPNLSSKLENSVHLKREDLQPVFSFKIRGAYNKIAHLTEEERANGIVCCSAGNHAQGVAFTARRMGISAKIFMPVVTPSIKVNAVRRYGVDVVLVGTNYDETYAACLECARKEGRALVHPFDDPLVIAGQGTIAMEVLKQTSADGVDAVFVCCGGGGMLSGMGAFIKAVAPHVKVVGVEAADAPTLTESLKAGRIVELDSVGTFADGAAVRVAGNNTFRLCQQVVDEMVTVSTDEICAAIKDAFTDIRVVLEPAGALAIAGMKKFVQKKGWKGKRLVATASGANMDFDRLRFVSERADTSESLVSVVIPERPGSFKQLYDIIYPRAVTEFSYRLASGCPEHKQETAERGKDRRRRKRRRRGMGGRSGDEERSREEEVEEGTGSADAFILMSYKAAGSEDEEEVERRMAQAGFVVNSLNDNELAKVHGRHLVGGRTALAANEVLYRFDFPERPGILRKFLYSMSSERWNVSLFHYRNHGSDVGRVLCGIQVPPDERPEFE
eukprot:Cvel_26434.t1-p1 / transcript=Cvel_26434.t1 / gene=Cvel_26434 / organism=Chromera_velia_CCMP2878 / gene_product=Threonine dehydratase, mitochondrial, putative / transcript_product=Threonine dehydratase, mitochondrial, putative / location=Cvel_scaffold3140:233-5118(-) / protein_length=598 / sequence_SO=supercontig / SO=protein_coding / is_pseudo=false